MTWEKFTPYYWQSDTGYRIAAGRVRGVVQYCAFAPPDADGERASLGCSDKADQARAACDAHAREAKP